LPTLSELIAPLAALPPLKLTGLPKSLPSILNCTVPPGVPDPGALALTVAVNVTACPNTDGLADELTAVVVPSWFTVCVKSGDVLPLKLPSPLYTVVMMCGPIASDAIAPLVALPPLKLTGLPKSVPSILNCTVPLGVPAPGTLALTVAVNVTLCPNTDGLADEVTLVLVSALSTTCVSAPDVLPLKLPSPPYTAVIAWLPTANEEIFNVATPPLNVPVPIVAAPSLNVTVPLGVPDPGALALTVAVNVTLCPNTDGVSEVATLVLLFAWFTTCVSVGEVLPVKLPSPP